MTKHKIPAFRGIILKIMLNKNRYNLILYMWSLFALSNKQLK